MSGHDPVGEAHLSGYTPEPEELQVQWTFNEQAPPPAEEDDEEDWENLPPLAPAAAVSAPRKRIQDEALGAEPKKKRAKKEKKEKEKEKKEKKGKKGKKKKKKKPADDDDDDDDDKENVPLSPEY